MKVEFDYLSEFEKRAKLRLLLLSDIHFLYCDEYHDRYRLLKQELLNEMGYYTNSNAIDALIICGDIASTGQKSQYTIAEKYFEKILKKLTFQGKKPRVFVVPGNHDVDRTQYKCTRRLFRDTFLNSKEEAENCLAEMKKNETSTLKILYSPFKSYSEFASKYSSNDSIAETILSGGDSFEGANFSSENTLGKLNDYVVKIVGLNSALICDSEDIRDAKTMQKGQHKLFLPYCSYNVSTEPYIINISVMHHPFDWMQNGSELNADFDAYFKLQLFGHIHSQSIYQKDNDEQNPVRIQVGSLQPGDDDSQMHAPRYSIVELSVENDKLHVSIKCRKWNKPHFEDDNNSKSSGDKWVHLQNIKEWTIDQKTEAKKMGEEVKLAPSIYDIRYRFTKSPHKKDIIEALLPGTYDKKKSLYANSILFFNKIVEKGREKELQIELDKKI